MTGQIPDCVKYKNELYDLQGIDGEGLCTAESLGIEARMASTACWRGYKMTYAIRNGFFILDEIRVNTNNPIKVNDIRPKKINDLGFRYNYSNLNFQTNFTGTIIIAKDFISSMYVHMGFQRVIAYEKAIQIVVKKGKIVSEEDISAKVAKQRKRDFTKESRPETSDEGDVSGWIAKTFSREIDLEDD